MFEFLTKVLTKKSKRVVAKKAPPVRGQARPEVEGLEDRQMMAANLLPSGHLVINGTNGNDVAVVQQINPFVVRVTDNGVNKFFLKSAIKQVDFYGWNGNDYFRNDTNISSYARGGNGNDILIGGSNRDWLFGEHGRDRLYGRAGNDYLAGGQDNLKDYLYGGTGFDTFQRDLVFFFVNIDKPQDQQPGEPIVA